MNLRFWLMPVILVLAVTLISGCLGGSTAKDCGEDMMCFAEAGQTCTPAKVTMYTQEASFFMEILGGTADACNIFYEFDMGELGGKMDMTCTVPTTQQADISDPQKLCDMCSGSLLPYYCD